MSGDASRPPPAEGTPGAPPVRSPPLTAPAGTPEGVLRDAPAPWEPRSGERLAGRYVLGARLGAGGMGVVFAAEQAELGVPVAIKLMHAHVARDTEYVRRFRREARAASLLSHPHAVRVLDYGQEHGAPFLVMEHVDGPSLREWLAQNGPPPLATVGVILGQLAAALEAAHALGIVHRDLKSDNVLLGRDTQGKLCAKVTDFGLAHVEDARDVGPTLTQVQSVAGTPAYMSPEQCRSLAVGPSTDLYALGCLLTELLQGRPPFQGQSTVEVISQQMFLPPPPLERPVGAEPVPPLLERLRLDLLAKHPHQRPPDAAAVRARLDEALSPELSARREPPRAAAHAVTRAERALAPSSTAEGAKVGAAAGPPAELAPLSAVLLRVAPGVESGVTDLIAAGLGAQGIELTPARVDAPQAAGATAVIVIDAARDLAAARAALASCATAAPGVPTVVCLGGLTPAAINELIAAGAGDVLAHPVSADQLARRVRRVARRRS